MSAQKGTDMKPLVVVASSDPDEFENKCSELLGSGYTLSSSSCGFVNSIEYDFCDSWHAVFVWEAK
jgi:hypothetical protein